MSQHGEVSYHRLLAQLASSSKATYKVLSSLVVITAAGLPAAHVHAAAARLLVLLLQLLMPKNVS
jgi:hypothetical protein